MQRKVNANVRTRTARSAAFLRLELGWDIRSEIIYATYLGWRREGGHPGCYDGMEEKTSTYCMNSVCVEWLTLKVVSQLRNHELRGFWLSPYIKGGSLFSPCCHHYVYKPNWSCVINPSDSNLCCKETRSHAGLWCCRRLLLFLIWLRRHIDIIHNLAQLLNSRSCATI